MPRIGTPRPNTFGLALGATVSCTEAGPPERIMALGAKAAISWSGMLYGRISQYTPASRTRRAISWVTWEPKSTISKRSAMGGYKRTGGGLQCGSLGARHSQGASLTPAPENAPLERPAPLPPPPSPDTPAGLF